MRIVFVFMKSLVYVLEDFGGGMILCFFLIWKGCEFFGVAYPLSLEIAVIALSAFALLAIGYCYANELIRDDQIEAHRQNQKLQGDIKQFQAQIGKLNAEIQRMQNERQDFLAFLHDTEQSSPWLSRKISDFVSLVDERIANQLKNKKNPAMKAADQVHLIAREKRDLLRHCKELEYQIGFYEGLFPWLEEFKTLPTDQAVEYTMQSSKDSNYDYVRDWLSPEEYSRLSEAEKNQLALDRYRKRRKSDWEIGIEYERYIGYLYESHGYRVTYNGASQGLADMGRDIIAAKGDELLVIQCKRWSKDKEIHEKHIFQLYGSTVLLSIENQANCRGIFVTTAKLSPLAKRCADYLGVECVEAKKMEDYPQIKCNVSKSGERIYHLPFDQQYDRVQIFGKEGATFAWTVSEAEKAGFRHAHKWVPGVDA